MLVDIFVDARIPLAQPTIEFRYTHDEMVMTKVTVRKFQVFV